MFLVKVVAIAEYIDGLSPTISSEAVLADTREKAEKTLEFLVRKKRAGLKIIEKSITDPLVVSIVDGENFQLISFAQHQAKHQEKRKGHRHGKDN